MGFFEVSKPTQLTPEQTELVKKHLALVFKHEIDPSYGDQNHQNELNAIHNPPMSDDNITFIQQPFGKSDDGTIYRC